MGAPRKFDAETRERAVRMYRDRLAEAGDTKIAARKHVGALLDINPATIRNWVEKDEPPSGQSEAEPGVDRDAELKALRREVQLPDAADRGQQSHSDAVEALSPRLHFKHAATRPRR